MFDPDGISLFCHCSELDQLIDNAKDQDSCRLINDVTFIKPKNKFIC